MNKYIRKEEWKNILFYFLVITLLFGTVTALWVNPFFIRKIEVKNLDYVIFAFYAILGSLYMGIDNKTCAINKKNGYFGGLLGFLGFACPTCNMILVMLVGNSILLTYFEPIRHIVGFIGVFLLFRGVYSKIEFRK